MSVLCLLSTDLLPGATYFYRVCGEVNCEVKEFKVRCSGFVVENVDGIAVIVIVTVTWSQGRHCPNTSSQPTLLVGQ